MDAVRKGAVLGKPCLNEIELNCWKTKHFQAGCFEMGEHDLKTMIPLVNEAARPLPVRSEEPRTSFVRNGRTRS